jgi:hypothetical protein
VKRKASVAGKQGPAGMSQLLAARKMSGLGQGSRPAGARGQACCCPCAPRGTWSPACDDFHVGIELVQLDAEGGQVRRGVVDLQQAAEQQGAKVRKTKRQAPDGWRLAACRMPKGACQHLSPIARSSHCQEPALRLTWSTISQKSDTMLLVD